MGKYAFLDASIESWFAIDVSKVPYFDFLSAEDREVALRILAEAKKGTAAASKIPKESKVASQAAAVVEKTAEVKPAGKPEVLQPPVAEAVTKILPKEKEEPRVSEKPVQEKPAVIEKPSAEEKWAVPATGDIIIGGTFDISRNAKNLSTNYIDGLELAFGQANETGGIKGRNIVLKVKDDGSNTHKAYENVQELRNVYKTDLITGPMGASTMAGIIDLVKNGEILSVFPFLASPIVRRPSLKYVINYMVGSFQVYFPMFKYALEKMGARKPIIVYTNDFPDTIIDMMMRGIKVEDYAKEPISAENVQFPREVEDTIKQNPDLIVFLTYPTSAVSFLNQLASKMPDKIIDKIVMIDSSLVGEAFNLFMRQKVTRFVMASSVPDPNKVELTIPAQNEKTPLKLYIIENYKVAAQKKGVSVNSIGLIGYISGKLLVEILRHVDGVITKEKVIEAAASMKDVDIEGLPISYDPIRHQLAKYAFLDTSSENWFAIDVSKVPYFEFLSAEDLQIQQRLLAEAKQKKAAAVAKKSSAASAATNGSTIQLAATMDLTDGLKANSLLLEKSIKSLFANVNKEGGINGKKIDVTIRDDAYDAPKAIENIDYFLNVLKISTLIAPVGTPTLESYLGKVKMSQLLVLFPLSGSDLFRSPDLKYIINFRCSYNYESYALARYAIETLHAKKIALFYQTTAPGIEGALKYFKEANFNDHFELNYNEQDVKFQEQARKIEQEKPDVLMLFSIQTASLGLLQEMGTFTKTVKLLGWSILSGDTFQNPWRAATHQGIVIANVVPNPAAELSVNTKYPRQLIQKFQIFAKDNAIPLDTTALEGYIDARITVELYKQAQNDISNEKIIELAEKMNGYLLDDLKLTFNPETRELYNTIWLDSGNGEWEPIIFGATSAQPA